jgi:tRNA A-37 threonylcarbamoyl transferase component Bud32
MNEEYIKLISTYAKTNGRITTPLGDITNLTQIGQGGNALVYSADWGYYQVAVKILAENFKGNLSSKGYERFIDEIRGLLQLTETGIVAPIYYFGLQNIGDETFPFLAMKLFPYTLERWIERNRPTSLDQLLPIIERLIYCLRVLHNHSIVHRDIKPKNIFVDNDGRIVLGDFGIAWFDPEIYDKLAFTSENERLANYSFSAPEQFQRNPEPLPTMDLYALGQIIQWAITGHTHSGTGRIPLASIDWTFRVIDPLVDALLQHDPEKRIQSASLTQTLMNELLIPSAQVITPNWWANLEEFDRRLSEIAPGGKGLFALENQGDIDRIFNILARGGVNYGLWWSRGASELAITRLEKINDEIWLINDKECKIEAVWIQRDRFNYNKQFILLRCAAMLSFGIANYEDPERELAGLFHGRYISYEEYVDGFANIESEITELDETAERRIRERVTQYMFLIVQGSDILYAKNEATVAAVYRSLMEKGMVEPNDLVPLNHLVKNRNLID